MSKRKRRPKRKIFRYPSLTFLTSGWSFYYWTDDWFGPDLTAGKRKKYQQKLRKKLAPLERAMSAGLGRRRMDVVPDELVVREYHAAVRVARSLKTGFLSDATASFLKTGVCEYFGERDLRFQRPLFVGELPKQLKRLVNHDLFAYFLVGDLFGISKDRAQKKDQKGRDRFRLKVKPNETQDFLVAAFVIQARRRKDVHYLREILKSLYSSGYDARALYHMVRSINRVPSIREGPLRFQRMENDILRAMGALDKASLPFKRN